MREYIPIAEYLQGTPEVPRICRGDAYTIGSGPHMSQDAKDHSVFQIIARKTKPCFFADDDRIVFHGLRRIIRDLFSKPVTHEEIDSAAVFLRTFHAGGTDFRFDEQMWRDVVDKYQGMPPITIEAMPDGTTFFPFEPVIQITTPNGFGNLAVWFESKLLSIWATSERATDAVWWREHLRRGARKLHPEWTPEEVNFNTGIMLHDFGDRAGACEQESETVGTAQLMAFAGTDTTCAAYLDYMETREAFACSIHAGAHWSVGSFKREGEFHSSLFELGKKTGITAHVSDTYDFDRTLDMLGQMIVDDPDGTNAIVVRPDSGDNTECILAVLATCEKYGLYTESPNGVKMATRLRWIQGNSVNWDEMQSIMEACIAAGWSPYASGAFGVGGYLRDCIARGNTGLSMKMVECGLDRRPVAKKSGTEAKSWGGGRMRVYQTYQPHQHSVYLGNNSDFSGKHNKLVVWYNGQLAQYKGNTPGDCFERPSRETNAVARDRIDKTFLSQVKPDQTLSKEVIEARKKAIKDNGEW